MNFCDPCGFQFGNAFLYNIHLKLVHRKDKITICRTISQVTPRDIRNDIVKWTFTNALIAEKYFIKHGCRFTQMDAAKKQEAPDTKVCPDLSNHGVIMSLTSF